MARLRLNEFKTLYRYWKTGIPYWDHLLLAVLWSIEDRLIQYRASLAVDLAIKEWEEQHPSGVVSPIYTESRSETSTSLPEMRLTAPWYHSS